MNKAELKFLLNKFGISPRKEQGQNFLIDDGVIEDIIRVAQLSPDDTVLEIGPGFGVLTTALAEHAGRVITIEQDRDIFPAVEALAEQYKNITAVNQSIQEAHLVKIGLEHENYKLVANLPYSVTSWILRQFTEREPAPTTMTVMVQKEVAERVAAQPGQMSVLACAVQLYCTAKIVREVDKTSFHPQPKVQSAVLHIKRREQPQSADPHAFMRLVKQGFAAKRKKLRNNLAGSLHTTTDIITTALKHVGASPDARAQELSLEQWEALRITLHHTLDK